jgi:hypothetical protein
VPDELMQPGPGLLMPALEIEPAYLMSLRV